jgi:sortase A
MDDSQDDNNKPKDPAVELIRQKVSSLYKEEPSAKEEEAEVIDTSRQQRSKHQEFMYRLTVSGKSLADIQTDWHNYYVNLPEHEKHEVWQEFYQLHDQTSSYQKARPHKAELQPEPTAAQASPRPKPEIYKTFAQIKDRINKTAANRGKLKYRQHFQSLMFGLGLGSLVVFILLFSFFNDRIIAPFITPSRDVSATPIIDDTSTVAPNSNSDIIIPKINVEIPVVYNETSIDPSAVENSLEDGVVHYPTTVNPGQLGNAAFFGHSSNNIFNPGKYKFAFALLRKLVSGDIFYLDKGGVRYSYVVYQREIVSPNDTSVLGVQNKPATVSLITCDPPGTSINRLVVVGEQISPAASTDVASTIVGPQPKPAILPGNSPSLWQRLKQWLTG